MKTVTYEISDCYGCPFFSTVEAMSDLEDGTLCHCHDARINTDFIYPDDGRFPNFCPLEDAVL